MTIIKAFLREKNKDKIKACKCYRIDSVGRLKCNFNRNPNSTNSQNELSAVKYTPLFIEPMHLQHKVEETNVLLMKWLIYRF